MADFFYNLHQLIRLCQSLEATVGTPKWVAMKKNPIITRYEKDIKDAVYWENFHALLHAIWPVLKLLKFSDSNKPDMDCLYGSLSN